MNVSTVDAKRRWLLLAGAALGLVHKKVFAAHGAQRFIVVGGALAEIVYLLGEQGHLVAADITCTYPPDTARLPKIGYQRTLSAEGLLAMRPNLLLASAEAGPPGVLGQISGAGVQVVTLAEGHDAASVVHKISGVAQALDDAANGERLRARFEHDWQVVQAQIAASPLAKRSRSPRVVFVLQQGSGQAMIAGQSTAANAMIALAGAENALQGFKGYRPLTPEALVAAAPDVILTTHEGIENGADTHGAGNEGTVNISNDTPDTRARADALFANPAFANTPAGRAKRLVAMDTLFLLGFGPRLPQAVLTLNRLLNQSISHA